MNFMQKKCLIVRFLPIVVLIFIGLGALISSTPNVGGFGIASACLFAQDDLDLAALDESSEQSQEVQSSETENDVIPLDSPTEPINATSSGGTKFLDLVLASGWIGIILLLCSIFAVSLIIRLCLMLRRSVFVPVELEKKLTIAISNGDYRSALNISNDGSFLGASVGAGLKEVDRGWDAVEKAIEDAVSEQSAALYRKTEPLSVIGNVAPMLGLLGTVVGMVVTFGELAVADVGGRNLANGIYFALVTTVDGLIVAIPILVAHSLLNTRIASLVSESVAKTEKVVEPLKRRSGTVSSSSNRNDRNVTPPKPEESVVKSKPVTQAPNVSSESTLKSQIGLREIAPQESPSEQNRPRPSLSLKNRQ